MVCSFSSDFIGGGIQLHIWQAPKVTFIKHLALLSSPRGWVTSLTGNSFPRQSKGSHRPAKAPPTSAQCLFLCMYLSLRFLFGRECEQGWGEVKQREGGTKRISGRLMNVEPNVGLSLTTEIKT